MASLPYLNMSSLKARAIHVFLIFWLHRVFVAACGLSLVEASWGKSLVAVRGLLIAVASLVEHEPWAHTEECELSGCGLRALEHGLRSCGAQASFP